VLAPSSAPAHDHEPSVMILDEPVSLSFAAWDGLDKKKLYECRYYTPPNLYEETLGRHHRLRNKTDSDRKHRSWRINSGH